MIPAGTSGSVCGLLQYICYAIALHSWLIWSSSGPVCLAGTFKLSLQFTEEYPNKAPVVKFVSNIFHPNGMWQPPALKYVHLVM